jgi:hypothetical protein
MNEPSSLCFVSLYIKGDELDPHTVTKILGNEPTLSQIAKPRMELESGMIAAAKTGAWGLTLRREDTDAVAVLEELANAVAVERLVTIPGVEEAYFDVLVVVDADASGEGEIDLEIAPMLLKELARANIPVRVKLATVART